MAVPEAIVNPSNPTFADLCEFFCYTPKNRELTTAEAAAVLGIKPNTLEIKRSAGGGPPYIKPPGCKRVTYNEHVLLAFKYAGIRRSTSQPVPAYA